MNRPHKTLIRNDIAAAVHQNVGLPHSECNQLVKEVLSAMIDALSDGEIVKISSFGSFNIIKKRERIGRNPKTGETAVIKARKVISFKPSHTLKSKIESRPIK